MSYKLSLITSIATINLSLKEEIAELITTIQQQQSELTALKPIASQLKKENKELEKELDSARKKLDEQEDEISQLYDLQDSLEQYTLKNSLAIHGIPEDAHSSTDEVILKLADSLDVLWCETN